MSTSRKLLDNDIAGGKSSYITQLVNTSKSSFFSQIHSITMQDQLLLHVFLNSTSATSDEEKANLFNEYFHSVYSPASSCNALPTINVTPNLSDTDISIHDTFTALTNLDPLKATVIDDIGPRLLKTCSTPL